jgi:catechol 2,3-dioxygenase-like lactoylglutathione lyase family enzyme
MMLESFPISARLPASDIGRARAWYSERLGLEPAKEGPMGNLWYETGGTWFLLYLTPAAGTARNTAAGWQVKGIESVMAELRARGVVFEEYDLGEHFRTVNGLVTLPYGEAAWFKDSEGNIIELSEVTE